MEFKKKIVILLIVILVIVVVYVTFSFLLSKKELVNNTNQNLVNLVSQDYNKIMENTLLTDSDLDGLTNVQEKELGTNPDNSDTDNDGLQDNSEIQIHKTNPLKVDTDGDGKGDGYEVRRNLDPLKK